MGLGYKNNINAAVTAVSNTFIDEYMGTASGEYVKVYLYLLRHAGESVEIPDIADALNHTEADVRRALAYWERAGVLAPEKEETVVSESAVTRENMTDTGYMAPESRRNYGDTDVEGRMPEETMADNGKQPQSSDRGMAKQQSGTPDIPDAGNSYDRMKRRQMKNSLLSSTRSNSTSERRSAPSSARNSPISMTFSTCPASFWNTWRNTALRAATPASVT